MKTTNFLKLALALIVGDDATAKSLKIQGKAAAALTAQIAVRKAQTLDLEENLATALETADKALVNFGNLIEADGKDRYISGLLTANDGVTRTQDALDKHVTILAFLEEKLALVK